MVVEIEIALDNDNINISTSEKYSYTFTDNNKTITAEELYKMLSYKEGHTYKLKDLNVDKTSSKYSIALALYNLVNSIIEEVNKIPAIDTKNDVALIDEGQDANEDKTETGLPKE